MVSCGGTVKDTRPRAEGAGRDIASIEEDFCFHTRWIERQNGKPAIDTIGACTGKVIVNDGVCALPRMNEQAGGWDIGLDGIPVEIRTSQCPSERLSSHLSRLHQGA